MSHNAAYIGFVYTSLSLKDHRDGWLQREGGMGGVKDGDHGSICGLRVPGRVGGMEGELCPAYKHGLGDVVLVVVGISQFVCLFYTLQLG